MEELAQRIEGQPFQKPHRYVDHLPAIFQFSAGRSFPAKVLIASLVTEKPDTLR